MLTTISDNVSIVIPTYNESRNLFNLLEDIAKQKHCRGIKIYIVDGNSKDLTPSIIRQSIRYYENIQIIAVEDLSIKSAADARNVGLVEVKTPYVIFIDANIRLQNVDTLYQTFLALEKHKVVTACFKTHTLSLYSLGFLFFNLLNHVLTKIKPFVLSSYFATPTYKLRRLGGFSNNNVSSSWWITLNYKAEDYYRLPLRYHVLLTKTSTLTSGIMKLYMAIFLSVIVKLGILPESFNLWVYKKHTNHIIEIH